METQRNKQAIGYRIRWMIRRDLPDVLRIESKSFEFPWSEEDFLGCLRRRNCVGLSAEDDGERVIGFLIYDLHQHHLNILSLAIDPQYIRQGIGSAFIAKLKEKLRQQRREAISTVVRERNLPAQLFFRSQGFKAIGTIRNHYEDTDEDAIVFCFELGAE